MLTAIKKEKLAIICKLLGYYVARDAYQQHFEFALYLNSLSAVFTNSYDCELMEFQISP